MVGMKIVLVKYQDPTTYSSWMPTELVSHTKPKLGFVCGYLFEENEDTIKVALMCSEDRDTWAEHIVIPQGCVVSVDVIKEVDWDEG